MNNAFREVPESLYKAESQILKLIEDSKAYDERIDKIVEHYRRMDSEPSGVVTRNKIEIGASILLNPLDVTAEEIHVFEEMLINWLSELGIEVEK